MHILVPGAETKSVKINGLIVHYVKTVFFGRGFLFSLTSVGWTNQIIEKYGIDIVHGQSPSSFGYALLSKADRPYVVTLHGTSFGELSSFSTMPITRYTLRDLLEQLFVQSLTAFLTNIEYKYADKVIAVSRAMAKETASFYRLSEDKIVVIHNGVNLPQLSDKQAEQPSENRVILTVGRLTWRKGFKYLIDALPQVLAVYPNTRLLIVGNGEQRMFLEERVRELRIQHSVQFLGRVSSEALHSLRNNAEVYVQPSLYEPFPLAILETMSMGKPIVATRVGGIPELITDREEGLLVEPANSLQLAGAIKDVFSDSSLGKRLGNNARKRVGREFTWNAIAKKTFELYTTLLNSR